MLFICEPSGPLKVAIFGKAPSGAVPGRVHLRICVSGLVWSGLVWSGRGAPRVAASAFPMICASAGNVGGGDPRRAPHRTAGHAGRLRVNQIMIGRLDDLLGYLRRLAPADDPGSDAQLLQRFAAARDERAFEMLARRHGPMVLGVCRRVLGDAQEAEDAFQATFLILARKATSAARYQSAGAWLHNVAYRVALLAR